jgi:hypothetical protein
MAAFFEPRWVLVALATCAASCATYGPDLLSSPLEGQAGTSGNAGNGGNAGSAGSNTEPAGSGGSAGNSAASAGSGATEGGAPDTPPTAPYLTAKIDEPPAAVSLTAEGELDWAHWGLDDASAYHHKADVTSHLLDFKPVGAKAPASFGPGPTTFSWTDGTPAASGSSGDGIAWAGLDEGFELVVPAVAEPRRLRLYVGVFAGTGRIKAALSDPRATTKVDTPLVSAKQAWVQQVVSLEYGGADQPKTTLNFTFSVEAMISPSAAVGIDAIAIDNP